MRLRLHKDQRGFGPVEIIIVLVVVLGLAGAGYYILNKNKDDKGTTVQTAQSKEIQDACNKAYDDKDFCKFASSWSFGGEQKMTITTPEDGSVSVFETDAKGNTRMVTTQDGTETAAFISIGNASYIKNIDDGNWTKFVSEETEETVPDPSEDIEADFDFDEEFTKDTSKITKQGKEACGDLTCFKYSMTDTNAPGEETVVWFDDQDYKLRRMTTTNSNGTSDMSFEYSVAAITEPSPVVEMPTFDEDMSAEELQQLMEQFGQ